MFGLSCIFDKRQHKIIHPRFEEWMKRHIPGSLGDRLFVYFHTQAGTFVIALWDTPRKKKFRDVVNLQHDISGFDRRQALNLILNLRSPVSAGEYAAQLRKGHQAMESARIDDLCITRDQRLHKKSNKLSLLFSRR